MKKMRVFLMLTLVEQVVWTLRVTSQTPNIWMMAMIVVKMMRIVKVMVMIVMVTYDEIGDDGEDKAVMMKQVAQELSVTTITL